jgi:hypothetical protein
MIIAVIVFLYKWQTLVSGLVALGAAFIGWRAVRKQIAHSDKQFDLTREQRFTAERAALAHVLTQISAYGDICLSQISTVISKMFDSTGVEKRNKVLTGMLPNYDAPALPTTIVPELKACLEYAPADFGRLIVSLLIDLQVQQSRIQSLWQDVKHSERTIITRHNFESAFLDAASIKAHADNLYKYARFQADQVPDPLNWATFENAIASYSGSHLGGAFNLLSLRQREGKAPQLMLVGPSNELTPV